MGRGGRWAEPPALQFCRIPPGPGWGCGVSSSYRAGHRGPTTGRPCLRSSSARSSPFISPITPSCISLPPYFILLPSQWW